MNSRDNARERKRKLVRQSTECLNLWTKGQKQELFQIGKRFPVHARPKTRGDCVNGIRPCPFVGCRHNLYLEVNVTGNISMRFPDRTPDEMTSSSCSLDVADEGGMTLEDAGVLLNITRERVRQIEELGLAKIKRRALNNPNQVKPG